MNDFPRKKPDPRDPRASSLLVPILFVTGYGPVWLRGAAAAVARATPGARGCAVVGGR